MPQGGRNLPVQAAKGQHADSPEVQKGGEKDTHSFVLSATSEWGPETWPDMARHGLAVDMLLLTP